MYVQLGTYDWKSAKVSFEKSGIAEVGRQVASAFDEARCPSYLLSPFVNGFHLLNGIRKLLEPDYQKEINLITERVNELDQIINSGSSVRKRDIQELRILLNKLVYAAKKSGDKDAVVQAKRYRSDFDKKLEKYL